MSERAAKVRHSIPASVQGDSTQSQTSDEGDDGFLETLRQSGERTPQEGRERGAGAEAIG